MKTKRPSSFSSFSIQSFKTDSIGSLSKDDGVDNDNAAKQQV